MRTGMLVDENWDITQRVVVISPSTFQDNPWVPSAGVKDPEERFLLFSFEFLTPEDGTDRFSRNVGKKLPLLAAQ